MVTALKMQGETMTRLITVSELENLTEPELRLTFNRIVNDISRNRELSFEYHQMLASLENIERELYRRRLPAPKL